MMLLAVAISGCFYAPATFYRPDAVSGQVVRAHCPPHESGLLVEQQGVVIGFHLTRVGEASLKVSVAFEIPEGHEVVVLDPGVEILDRDGGRVRGRLTGRPSGSSAPWASSPNRGAVLLKDPLQGRTRTGLFARHTTFYGNTRHAYYHLAVTLRLSTTTFASPSADELVLHGPRVEIDGTPIEWPPLRFRRVTEWDWQTLNC